MVPVLVPLGCPREHGGSLSLSFCSLGQKFEGPFQSQQQDFQMLLQGVCAFVLLRIKCHLEHGPCRGFWLHRLPACRIGIRARLPGQFVLGGSCSQDSEGLAPWSVCLSSGLFLEAPRVAGVSQPRMPPPRCCPSGIPSWEVSPAGALPLLAKVTRSPESVD